jgi:hypothetical protein
MDKINTVEYWQNKYAEEKRRADDLQKQVDQFNTDIASFNTYLSGVYKPLEFSKEVEELLKNAPPSAEDLLRQLLSKFTIDTNESSFFPGINVSFREDVTIADLLGEDFEVLLLPYLNEDDAKRLQTVIDKRNATNNT